MTQLTPGIIDALQAAHGDNTIRLLITSTGSIETVLEHLATGCVTVAESIPELGIIVIDASADNLDTLTTLRGVDAIERDHEDRIFPSKTTD